MIKPWSCGTFAAVFGGVIGCRTIPAVDRLTVTGGMFEEVNLLEHKLEEVGKDGQGAREDDRGNFGATSNRLAGNLWKKRGCSGSYLHMATLPIM